MATFMRAVFLRPKSAAVCLSIHPRTRVELHLCATGLNWSSCNHDKLNIAQVRCSQGKEHSPLLRHRSSVVYLSLTESAL